MPHPPLDLPGVTPIGGPEPTLEWIRPSEGVLGVVAARLGSDPRAEELLVAVMRSLRARLPRETWEGIADELPFSTRALLRSDATAGTTGRPGADLVADVARAMQHPEPRARLEVRAVFASLRRALPRGLADAVPGELPADLAELWRTAR